MSLAQLDELANVSTDGDYQRAIRHLHLRSRVDDHPPGTIGIVEPDVELEIAQPNFSDMLQWLVWPGMALMVVSSLVSFAFSWRSVFALVTGWGRRANASEVPERTGDVPGRLFIGGLVAALLLSIVLQISFFAIVWWAAIIGVLLAFILAIVATRVSGETGITPVGVMGKIAQLSLGAIAPHNPAVNLMGANVAGGAASQSADLLDDLKCGYLLGAAPRLQALAQICGALIGALIGSAVYLLAIPHPAEQLLTDQWPAPGVAAVKAVAVLFQTGFQSIPEGTPLAMAVAALAAAALATLDRTLPDKVRRFLPSAASVGLAFVIPACMSVSMFIGGLVALGLGKWCRSWTQRFLVATCAGLIAGESLTGVGIMLSEVIPSA
jgi:OPT family oligopeptide transporter